MPDKKPDTRAATGADKSDPASAMMATFVEFQKAGLGPLQWLGTAWLENMGDLGGELSQFMAERIREDVKTQHEILHCRDAAKLQEIQSRFIQKAIEQYTAETGKLVELSHTFMDRLSKGKAN